MHYRDEKADKGVFIVLLLALLSGDYANLIKIFQLKFKKVGNGRQFLYLNHKNNGYIVQYEGDANYACHMAINYDDEIEVVENDFADFYHVIKFEALLERKLNFKRCKIDGWILNQKISRITSLLIQRFNLPLSLIQQGRRLKDYPVEKQRLCFNVSNVLRLKYNINCSQTLIAVKHMRSAEKIADEIIADYEDIICHEFKNQVAVTAQNMIPFQNVPVVYTAVKDGPQDEIKKALTKSFLITHRHNACNIKTETEKITVMRKKTYAEAVFTESMVTNVTYVENVTTSPNPVYKKCHDKVAEAFKKIYGVAPKVLEQKHVDDVKSSKHSFIFKEIDPDFLKTVPKNIEVKNVTAHHTDVISRNKFRSGRNRFEVFTDDDKEYGIFVASCMAKSRTSMSKNIRFVREYKKKKEHNRGQKTSNKATDNADKRKIEIREKVYQKRVKRMMRKKKITQLEAEKIVYSVNTVVKKGLGYKIINNSYNNKDRRNFYYPDPIKVKSNKILKNFDMQDYSYVKQSSTIIEGANLAIYLLVNDHVKNLDQLPTRTTHLMPSGVSAREFGLNSMQCQFLFDFKNNLEAESHIAYYRLVKE